VATIADLRSSQRFLAAELVRAGVEVRVLDAAAELIEARLGDHHEIFVDVAGSTPTHALAVLTSHKQLAKDRLTAAGISVPRGATFAVVDRDAALAFAQGLGFPLVVKPLFGTNGRHVHLGLESLVEVLAALEEIAADHGPDERVLVEEQFSGDEYRVLVTREGDYAVTRRDPPVVVGDGARDVAALAEAESLRRTSPRTSCAGPIVLDLEAERFLARRDLSLATIPAAGEVVQLRGNSNLCTGATGTDWTDRVHPSVIELGMQAIAAFPGLALAGLDFMSTDIGAPQSPATYRVLEINPLPGIGMHMAPSSGASREVARCLAELHFPELRSAARVPGLRPIPVRAAPPPEAVEGSAAEAPMTSGHHPIFETCLAALSESKGGEPFVLSAGGQAQLEAAIGELLTKPDLEPAVITIVQFALYLRDQYRSPTAAKALLDLTAKKATTALLARGGKAADALAQLRGSAEQLAALEGRDPARYEARSAPKQGQAKADPFARFAFAEKKPEGDDDKKKKKRR
jgi:D-alanine-D-alanine ligase-like ATP-grasp enzyme